MKFFSGILESAIPGDRVGNVTQLTLWWHFGDDTFSGVLIAHGGGGEYRVPRPEEFSSFVALE